MKQRTLLTLLATMLIAMSATADDATIVVAGNQVQLNKSGVIDGNYINGTSDCVYYNASTKTLRIKDAKIVPENNHGIYIGIDGVTIEFVGSSTVQTNAKNRNAICISANAKSVKIIGADSYTKVKFNTPATGNSAALQINSACTVSFEAIDADIDGYYGIRGGTNTGEQLHIGKDAHVRVRGINGSVTYVTSITYDSDYGLYFDSRDSNVGSGYFDSSKHAVCTTNGTTVANDYVHFGKYFQLDIDQNAVHSGNYRNLATALSCVSGNLSYDPSNQRLTTESGASVTPTNTTYDGNVIYSQHPLNVSIKAGFLDIKAENVNNGYALNVQGDLTITGASKDQCFLLTDACLYANGRITVEKTRLQLKGQKNYALLAGSLYATDTSIEATSDNANGTISTNLLSTPSAYWQDADEVCLIPIGGKLLKTPEGSNVSGRVCLTPGSRNFSLQVGAMTVSTDNFYPVKSDYISGEIYYVPAERLLILKDAKVKGMPGDGHGIVNHATNKPLNVKVVGKNQVVTERSCLEPGMVECEIYGQDEDAELLLQSEKGCGIELSAANNSDYTIRGLKLNVKAAQCGIKGARDGRLIFRNAMANLQADEGAVAGFWTVYHYDCFIASPANASYDNGAYKAGGNVVTKMLVARDADKLAVKVCGISVVNVDGYDILGDGAITFNASALPTLTFHKDVNYSGSYLIENTGVDALMVNTDAPCTLKAKTNIVRTDKVVGLTAPDHTLKLAVTSSSSTALYARQGGSLVINCKNLVIEECKWGIAGTTKNTEETLFLNGHATINSTAGAIMDFKSLTVIKDITEPAGGHVGDYGDGKSVLDADGVPANYVVIGQPTSDPADLNGDGSVNVGDVTTLVNMILGKSEKSDAADLNGDNSVNVGDVTTLVNIILGK